MKAKTWVIKRQEIFEITYIIESERGITEGEAKELLSRDGYSAGEQFDKSWIEDSPIDEWETLAVPDGKTFGLIFDRKGRIAYKLILLDRA